MTTFDTRDIARLRNAEPLTEADFDTAVHYRYTDRLFSRPAQYGESITLLVPGPNMQMTKKTVRCGFGEMIIFSREEGGGLMPVTAIAQNKHDNIYQWSDAHINGCREIFELVRIRRFTTDRMIRQPGQIAKEWLLNPGDLGGMGIRADGKHAFMPIVATQHARDGRPRIPDYFAACDENGNLLCARRTITSERER